MAHVTMLENVVRAALALAALYVAAGCIFAAIFLSRTIKKVDHQVEGAPLRFRLLILPGLVALWPLMWRGSHGTGASPEQLRRRHGKLIVLVLVVVLVISILALI